MDIVLHRCDGIPEGSMLSVRAGNIVKRQSPMEPGKPLKFPSEAIRGADGELSVSEVVVDVLAILGRAKLQLNPGTEKYVLQLESTCENRKMNCELEVRWSKDDVPVTPGKALAKVSDKPVSSRATSSAAPATDKPDKRDNLKLEKTDKPRSADTAHRHTKAISAQRFMNQHRLLEAMHTALQSAVTDRPEEPILHMSQKLIKLAEEFKLSPAENGELASTVPRTASKSSELASTAPQLSDRPRSREKAGGKTKISDTTAAVGQASNETFRPRDLVDDLAETSRPQQAAQADDVAVNDASAQVSSVTSRPQQAVAAAAARTFSSQAVVGEAVDVASTGSQAVVVAGAEASPPEEAANATQNSNGIGNTLEAMLAGLRHADPGVRRVAAETIGTMGGREAADGLRRCLEVESDDSVRQSVSQALRKISQSPGVSEGMQPSAIGMQPSAIGIGSVNSIEAQPAPEPSPVRSNAHITAMEPSSSSGAAAQQHRCFDAEPTLEAPTSQPQEGSNTTCRVVAPAAGPPDGSRFTLPPVESRIPGSAAVASVGLEPLVASRPPARCFPVESTVVGSEAQTGDIEGELDDDLEAKVAAGRLVDDGFFEASKAEQRAVAADTRVGKGEVPRPALLVLEEAELLSPTKPVEPELSPEELEALRIERERRAEAAELRTSDLTADSVTLELTRSTSAEKLTVSDSGFLVRAVTPSSPAARDQMAKAAEQRLMISPQDLMDDFGQEPVAISGESEKAVPARPMSPDELARRARHAGAAETRLTPPSSPQGAAVINMRLSLDRDSASSSRDADPAAQLSDEVLQEAIENYAMIGGLNHKEAVEKYAVFTALIAKQPESCPRVIGQLLDLDAPGDLCQRLLQAVGVHCPLKPLVEEAECREKLRLLLPWLEAREAEGVEDASLHDALAKLHIDLDRDPEEFLKTNPFYSSVVVGSYCEDYEHPQLAFIAYERARGCCDEQLIDVSNRNGLFRLQASYLLEQQSVGLWLKVLQEENLYLANILTELIRRASLTSSTSAARVGEVAAAVEALQQVDLTRECEELLDKAVQNNPNCREDPGLCRKLGKVKMQMGRTAQAIQAYLMAGYPEQSDYLSVVVAAESGGHFEELVNYLRRAHGKVDDPRLLERFAFALAKTSRFQEMEEVAELLGDAASQGLADRLLQEQNPRAAEILAAIAGNPSAAREDACQDVLAMAITVENVDYSALLAKPALLEAFTATVTQIIAHEAGVLPEKVELELSPGSVVVRARVILASSGSDSLDEETSKLASSETLSDSVARSLGSVPGIEAATRGKIEVSDISVWVPVTKQEPPKRRPPPPSSVMTTDQFFYEDDCALAVHDLAKEGLEQLLRQECSEEREQAQALEEARKKLFSGLAATLDSDRLEDMLQGIFS